MAGGLGSNRGRDSGPLGSGNGQQSRGAPGPQTKSQFQQQSHSGAGQVTHRPRDGGYDGPGEPSGPPRENPFGPGLGYDPAKPVTQVKVITNTRIELPAAAYDLENNVDKYEFPSELPKRPGTSTLGKAVQIRVNQFKVTQWPQKDVYQYDILIGNGEAAKGKVMAVWKSKAVQNKLKQFTPVPFLWDGNRLAWSSIDMPEQRILVNFDAEKGRNPQPGKEADTCYCHIRRSKVIRMAVIQGYLSKHMPFDNSVLEAISFLDHAMRQNPSEVYTMIKRSFFTRGASSHPLDNVIVAMKGVYSSIRLCNPQGSVGQPSTGLALNVDVANGTFWTAQDVHQAARNLLRARDYNQLRDVVFPIPDNKGGFMKSPQWKELAKMSKLKFTVKHRGKNDDDKIYTIKRFTFLSKKGGDNSKTNMFKFKNKNFTPPRLEDVTVFEYFRRQYNITIQYWELPLVETEKAGMFPMEVCTLVPNQRYNFKLSPDQTAAMIKFAVTRPKQRIESIQHGVSMLKWPQDPYLRHFGVQVDPNMTQTNARLLPSPDIQFGNAKLNPGTAGRWDLRGKKFFLPNPEPLKSWGVCVVNGCMQEAAVRNFMNIFIQTYIGHGGKVENKNPVIYIPPRGEDLALTVSNARLAAGNQAKAVPQILFYVLPGRDSFQYERVKKNNECRFALVSQCVNMAHVQKAQPQYCSNVCMKVNAKLGGATSKALNSGKTSFFSRPTMIIGADVSHAAPGSLQPSMAAITMSFDKDACRYAATCQTNGRRVEMITENTIKTLFIPMFEQWVQKVGLGSGPQHIYYFRDGVSEGQYTHVLNQEIEHFKKALIEKFGDAARSIKWTVTVCTKRHHLRFFPKDNDSGAGDRNGNALPGTLVEHDITHPFEYDFYLCSHAAIQGTARPVHYQVILDEAAVPVNDFQKMIYQMSYQYMRSTTPVSLFPAVYYAHLASNRARAHESAPISDGPRGGQKFEEQRQARIGGSAAKDTSNTGSGLLSEVTPLVPLGSPENGENMQKIRNTMWYI